MKKFFRTTDPLGRRIRLGRSKSTAPWLTVVGVVGDMFSGDQQEPMSPAVFQPFAQDPTTFVSISARTAAAQLASIRS